MKLNLTFVTHVINSVPKREIKAVIFPPTSSDIPEISGSGEIFPVLVEGHRHHPVGGVEGLLYPVPVVDIDIYVENPLVVLQQLQDSQHDIVDVAETSRNNWIENQVAMWRIK